MNCFSRLLIVFAGPALLGACGAPASESSGASQSLQYELAYQVTPDPATGTVAVAVEVTQERHLLREMRFESGAATLVEKRGVSITSDGSVIWSVPRNGGRISWVVPVANRRNGAGYDAWLGDSWGVFRAEDVIPRAATRTLRGATSVTSLGFRLPAGWSAVTQYRDANSRFAVDNPERRFDQPGGWIAIGNLGVRRDRIAGMRVSVAAPANQGVRRIDMLALLNWTLPTLANIVPELPPRLTIVSAGDPMWRGGLSAPLSIFLHADRPLISENGTSTLLHEVLHVTLGLQARNGYDWIVEGLAEYYSLLLLSRSGTLTTARFEDAMRWQSTWSDESQTLCGASSTGPDTAFAVGVFATLDHEVRESTDGTNSLDDILRTLVNSNVPVDIDALNDAVMHTIGRTSSTLHVDKLPGCRTIAGTDNSAR